MMNGDVVIGFKWCIIIQEMRTRQVQTPYGMQIVQEPVQECLFFRTNDEIIEFLNEQKNPGNQITLVRQEYLVGDNIKYYYSKEEEK